MTNDGPAFYKVCANCGADLGIEDWPPTVTAARTGGETALYSFCDEECKAAWNDDDKESD